MALNLTPRLRTVAELVPQDARMADVGTDHAYLPAWLLLHKRIPAAICTDLRPGPLERARETVKHYGIASQVSLRLCDGLAGVDAHEVDCVVIAGMGGETILRILAAAPWAGEKACVVQPMSSLPDLRSGVSALGLRVAREVLAQEGETLYMVMELASGKEKTPLTAAQAQVGRAEHHLGDPLWPQYLRQEERRLARAMAGLERSQKAEDELKRKELGEALAGIRDMMEEI